MSFEQYHRLPSATVPSATLQRHGTLTLNQAAIDLLGAPKFVDLLYDPDARIIGVRPTDNPESFVIYYSKPHTARLWACRGLCAKYGIDVAGQGRRMTVTLDGVGMMLICLDDGYPVLPGWHGRAPQGAGTKPVGAKELLPCKVCGKPCNGAAGLASHVRSAHPELKVIATVNSGKVTFDLVNPPAAPTVAVHDHRLLLRCDEPGCTFTAEPSNAGSMHSHTNREHDRRASTLERMPREADA